MNNNANGSSVHPSRKRIAIGLISTAAAAVLVFFGLRGSLAYLTDNESHTNHSLTKEINTTIVEDFDPPASPDKAYKKSVKISIPKSEKEIDTDGDGKADTTVNTKDLNCFVRVSVEFSDGDIAKVTRVTSSTASPESVPESAWHLFEDYKTTTKTNSGGLNSDDWVWISNADLYNNSSLKGGYFYYKHSASLKDGTTVSGLLKSGDMTSSLFESVVTTFPEDEDPRPYDIYVHTEAVQAEDKNGNAFIDTSGESGAAYIKAWKEYGNE